MRTLAALITTTLLISCGGGSGDPVLIDNGGITPTDSLIRYQGSWRGYRFSSTGPTPPATLTLQALPGQAGISTQPVTRVEVQLGQSAPVVLTAANATDASGRPQYVFDFGQLAGAANCSGTFPTLISITVVDARSFSYTKKIATCASDTIDFGAFSDYGNTSAQFSYTATAPITAFATRRSSTGYVDTLVPTSQASFNAALPSADTDALQLMINPNLPLPAGTRVVSRIEGGGGAFAQSTVIAANNSLQPFVALECCGPRPASAGIVDVQPRIEGVSTVNPYPPEATYTYRLVVTDPATGIAVGSQAGTTYGTAAIPLQVRRGHVIELDATPNDARAGLRASIGLGPAGSGGGTAYSNEVGTPARIRVFCCSP